MPAPDRNAVIAALATVQDPEIHKPITDIGMVDAVDLGADGAVAVRILLTVKGCPLKDKLTNDITTAVSAVAEVTAVSIEFGTMTPEQLNALKTLLRGTDSPENEIPFAKPNSRTRVYAVASGKGGVGKSSVTVNLAVALAERGLSVGIVDADIYGFSIPRMIGCTARPTQVSNMIMPPSAHGVKVISIGMFTPGNAPVVWRGPMLHRALRQFLADVYWGELDVLLIDLPPGTGDVAISLAQLLPTAELLVVTTPQLAAREVAERAGSIASQTHQQIVGVIENMSWLELPDGSRMEPFGSGGGQAVAESLSRLTGTSVPLLGQVPLESALRAGGDDGVPIVVSQPNSPAAEALRRAAGALAARQSSLVGRSLGLTPAAR